MSTRLPLRKCLTYLSANEVSGLLVSASERSVKECNDWSVRESKTTGLSGSETTGL
jgi:hypothetical protein